MKKIKVSNATVVALDWLVAKCEGIPVARHSTGAIYLIDTPWKDKSRVKWLAEYSPSKHWAQGGPIIEREHLEFDFREDTQDYACFDGYRAATGPTHLIAAMRCYVASKLGDEVEVPDELIKEKQP